MNETLNPHDPKDVAKAVYKLHLVEASKKPWLAVVLLRRAVLLMRRFIHFFQQLRKRSWRSSRILLTKFGLSLTGAALVLALSSTPVQASSISVDGTSCTLIDAIIAANTDTATGGCMAGSGADTIVLQPGSTHLLTNSYSNGRYGGVGLPEITSIITIEGNGATIERDSGASQFRILLVTSTGDLTINDSEIKGGYADYGGGGVANYGGDLIVNNSIITGNNSGFDAGGILNYEGTTLINDSTISNNFTTGPGGGILNSNNGNGAILTINNSVISGNTGGQGGGGIANFDGDVFINNSTVSGNSAKYGGGIDTYASFAYPATTSINNCTITGNTASDAGGGIRAIGKGGYYIFATVNLKGSIISGNTANSGQEIAKQAYSYVNVDNHNLFGFDNNAGLSGFIPGASDIVPGAGILLDDILDTVLQNNGGNTDTHALIPGSPAIDALPTAFCAAPTDQRGVSRPQGLDCDIGSFELEQVQNQIPTADAGGLYSVDEGSSVELNGSNSSDPDPGDELTYEWDYDYDGVIFDVDAIGPTPNFDASSLDGPTNRMIALRVTDNAGASDIATTDLTINNIAPTVGPIVASIEPVEVGSPVNASASFADPGIPDTHTAEWDWGDNSTSPGTVSNGTVTGSHIYTVPGVYTIGLTVTDDDGGMGQSVYEFVVIYDSDGGFVTGGGWIWSPAGAYTVDPSLTGKANFGFVSKYKKGASVPTGQTEFQFKAGDLNFHSSSYDWLVVAGQDKAKYKGIGTINGVGNYGFMLTATDGSPDTFRIKIWNKDNGDVVVYDNKMGFDDNAYDGTALGGGNIKVHKK